MRFTKWSYRNNEQPLNCFSKDVTLVTPDRMLGRQWPPLSRVVDAPVAECVKSRRTEIRQMSTLLEIWTGYLWRHHQGRCRHAAAAGAGNPQRHRRGRPSRRA